MNKFSVYDHIDSGVQSPVLCPVPVLTIVKLTKPKSQDPDSGYYYGCRDVDSVKKYILDSKFLFRFLLFC